MSKQLIAKTMQDILNEEIPDTDWPAKPLCTHQYHDAFPRIAQEYVAAKGRSESPSQEFNEMMDEIYDCDYCCDTFLLEVQKHETN